MAEDVFLLLITVPAVAVFYLAGILGARFVAMILTFIGDKL